MKIEEEKFKKAVENLKKVSLNNFQKDKILKNILSESEIKQSTPSPYFSIFYRRSFAAILGALILVVSTSYASAHSLPGELLYGVKIKVVEPVVLALKPNPQAKEEYKLSLLEKRIDELNTLDKEHKAERKLKRQKEEKILVNDNESPDSSATNTPVYTKSDELNSGRGKKTQLILSTEPTVKTEMAIEIDAPVKLPVSISAIASSSTSTLEIKTVNDIVKVDIGTSSTSTIVNTNIASSSTSTTISIPGVLPPQPSPTKDIVLPSVPLVMPQAPSVPPVVKVPGL